MSSRSCAVRAHLSVAVVVLLALVFATASSAAPRPEPWGHPGPRASDDLPLWKSPTFWKASAGAAAGAWLGAKALGWAPMLHGLSQIAKASPFTALMVRPMVPVLAGAIGAQIASRGFANADWAMVTAQTVGGAVGTAAALLIAPGAGWMAPVIGEAIGWYGGTWLLKRWRRKTAINGGPQLAAFGEPQIRGSASADPAVRDAATEAYERWLAAKQSGHDELARQAYSGVVSALAR